MQNESKTPRRIRRLILAGTATLLAGAVVVFGVARLGGPREARAAESQQDAKKPKDAALVAVSRVEPGSISAYVTATANLVAEDEVKVVSETEGKVVELLVEEGDAVARGQRLLQVDRTDAALAVAKAELALRNASLGFERSEKMADDELISHQDLDKARYDRDLARQALDEARHELQKTTVVAPFAGRITVRKVRLGQTVKSGDELLTLADFDPLVARVFLPEREVLDLRVGQAADLGLKAREDVRFRGRIRQISPVVDTASGTVKVTVEALQPPATVRPGAFVSVGIVRETRGHALLIPRPAVVRELRDTYVFVADGAVARKRPVELGLEEGDRLEVRGGLSAGDLVVVSGQGALKDGAPIKLATGGQS
jgi:membrane fusion protein, multidrug efflux system